jgi:hypothetical protein
MRIILKAVFATSKQVLWHFASRDGTRCQRTVDTMEKGALEKVPEGLFFNQYQ